MIQFIAKKDQRLLETVNADAEPAQKRWSRGILPGIALTAGLAAMAVWLHSLPHMGLVSALILAIVLGMAVRNMAGVAPAYQPGITFCLRKVLRLAIILLGLQLSFSQVRQVGLTGFCIVAASLTGTFLFTTWLGSKMGVDHKLSQLIAAGSSICGASAVIAANVVTNGKDEDVAYGVAVVTVFGSISMLLYPALNHLLGLSPTAFGVWAGASIHEIAQVIAAVSQNGAASLQYGTISKLTRVMLLAPTVIVLGFVNARRTAGESGQAGHLDLRQIPIPWFVLGFIAMIGVNTLNVIPVHAKAEMIVVNQFLLAISLAAMGLETSIAKLKAAGVKPLILGASVWGFISVFSFVMVKALYH